MKYEKPKVAVIGSASTAIQNGHKGGMVNPDGVDGQGHITYTPGAYEADE
jgi:hypothetical protein